MFLSDRTGPWARVVTASQEELPQKSLLQPRPSLQPTHSEAHETADLCVRTRLHLPKATHVSPTPLGALSGQRGHVHGGVAGHALHVKGAL